MGRQDAYVPLNSSTIGVLRRPIESTQFTATEFTDAVLGRQLLEPLDVVRHCVELIEPREHFDGGGKPARLAGEAIPVAARIALLAQVIDVFHTADGREAALREARALGLITRIPRLALVQAEGAAPSRKPAPSW